ncbi:GEX Interacting protein [Ditylenchus destructor]|nr:GEX Interacting protein [Ditylenchus destructor]
MNQDTIFYGNAPNQPPVQNVVGSSSNSVVSNSSNFGSVNSLPQNFVVVSNAACSCTSNYGDMTCGSPDCINKFQQNTVNIGAEAEQLRQQIQAKKARKAESARQRYHGMSIDERKTYNKRRAESLRRRRVEEEALLATPAGQIDADSLARVQQILLRHAMRAKKARQQYNDNSKQKSHEGTQERKRANRQIANNKVLLRMKLTMESQCFASRIYSNVTWNISGDILTAIERDVVRRTQEAKQVLEQRANPHQLYIKRENLPINEVINMCPVMNTAPVQGQTTFAPIQVHSGGPGESKPTTKYVSYMQLPAGTTQSGFLLAVGQFVALQPALHPQEHTIHTYPITVVVDKSEDDEMLHELAMAAQGHDIGSHHDIKDSEGQPIDDKEARRLRVAELARQRYQNMSAEEKKAVNSRRMLLRKRKRQCEREMEELEAILRATNDIEEDVVFIGEIREKKKRESRAKAARSRYQNLNPDECKNYNQKRRLRQLSLLEGTESAEAEQLRQQIQAQNARKAELARTVNIGAEAEQLRQQIQAKKARKAESARQRYHGMSIDERKTYNKRRAGARKARQ